MEIHIGEIIKKKARELRIGPTELGEKINTSKQNVYGIYKRKSIDTELLRKISNALGHNFFNYYVSTLEFSGGVEASTGTHSEVRTEVNPEGLLSANQARMDALKSELDHLAQINEILKEKAALSK